MTALAESAVSGTAAISRRRLLRSAAGMGAAVAAAAATGTLQADARNKRRQRDGRDGRTPRTGSGSGSGAAGAAAISAARVASGAGIAVRGHGFAPRSDVQIHVTGSEAAGDFSFIATAWTNANGFFAWTMSGYEPTRLEVTAWQIGGAEASDAWTD